MIAVSDALKVMSVVAACHPRTALRMDDREVALVTADVWADLFNEYRLELPDILAAVKKRGARHEVAPEPAEIIKYAREIRQDRSDRESDEERGKREELNDRKALDSIIRRTGQHALGKGLGEAS